uniref:Band 7 domain-containing protein n=1 Tax=Musca domestica TaxID=7370 RepID=A0A1I8MEV3_MUSDO
KDVRLPVAMQRAMAAEAEALREAKAKIVAAEGELSASRALKEASDVMSSNPITLQLRYLQTLSNISSERNSTIIFPFPIDLFKQIQLPRGMQRAMATEREAEREAQAKIVAANGELEASRNLREASDVMRGNPMALQLRYLQTLNTISNEYNHTIIFPFPVDALKRILGKYRTVALEGKFDI